MKGLLNYGVDAQPGAWNLQGGRVLECPNAYTAVKQALSLSCVNLSQLAWASHRCLIAM